MTAQEIWRELMDISDCECPHARLLRVAHNIEMYGEVGAEERAELEDIRVEYAEIAEKIGDILA